ncbi:uncharacterized protein LOC121980189 [Zingiber officinale]|uniref:uncharacterized protein LOC121980189 n=1 Tax=Zingiber officinale TaxID=94328 RepID=UPI001C4B271A|nr:uncharacterized protein LOC121980189 [Zingiber officinale]
MEKVEGFSITCEEHEELISSLRDWRTRSGINAPKIEVRFEDLSVETEVHASRRVLPTLPNAIINTVQELLGRLKVYNTNTSHVKVLSELKGIIKPSRMTLVLGSPGSGKTTFLRALSGKLDPSLKVTGKVTYNGQKMNHYLSQRMCAYVSQLDAHQAEMTVKETMEFSRKILNAGDDIEMLKEVSTVKTEANIKEETNTNTMETVFSKDEGSFIVDHILKVLGLHECANIIIGDQMRRGISGGQKKRVTIGNKIFKKAVVTIALIILTIGYGISRAEDDRRVVRILESLFRTWDSAAGGIRPSLSHGLMVLSLSEWCATGFLLSKSWSRIESLHRGSSVDRCKPRADSAPFLVLMASAGVLLAFRSNGVEISPPLGKSLELSISFVAESIISRSGSDSDADASDNSGVLLQCLAMALAWSGPIIPNVSVLRCLCLALLNEIFPVHFVTEMSLDSENRNVATNKVKEHLNSILFKQAGAVTRVFCNQYAATDDITKETVEKHLWDYSLELYSNLRLAVLVHRGKSDELLAGFEKIAEAAFLMIVVFAAEVSKHKLNSKTSNEFRPEVSSQILITFSCIEYLRRIRLPEYTQAVRRAVLTIQENAPSCVSFVESMPPYGELTKSQGSIALVRMRYNWSQDEVQTARISFYLRVLPACISLVPTAMFGERIAPTMFLYMQHPNEKVIRASHSVFVSFVSSSKDSDQNDRNALKEQLVFYYMHRALEVYPQINSFDGLTSGVTALVRHLPAGSPSIFYCVHSLVEKASELCRGAMSEDPTMWKNWEGNSGPPKKTIDLLLHLIYLIDIQALPYLLKQLAELMIQLPKDGQNALLDEMYSQVAESDDVTRKPVLVSWLQSLSYLCSQKTSPAADKSEKHGSSVASKGLSFIRGIAKL